MTWISALAIGGCILALGPIIIHIIFRRRYRTIDFAAMRFLLESLRRNRQRLRLEELLLILLRILACLLVGFMLANIRAKARVAGTAAPTAHVFIIDDSLSMGQRIGTTTLFRKAITEIAKQLEAMPDADRVAVVSASRPASGEPLGRLAPAIDVKRDKFADRLAAMKPTDLSVDFAAALGSAAKLVSGQEQMPVRLVLVSDFRQRDLTGVQRTERLRKAFEAFDPKTTEILLLDFGAACRNNLAVETIALGRKLVVAGVTTPVRVRIRNTGSRPSEPAQIAAEVGDVKLPAIGVPALAPNDTADVDFHYRFDKPGAAAVRASLPVDALPGDSRSALALQVRDAIRILIVDGSPDPKHPKSGSFCLAYALDPSGRATFGHRVDVVAAEAWQASRLEDYDLVVLTNVRELPVDRDADGRPIYPQLQALQDYVRNGGGLGVFLGDRINPDFYNGPLFAEGKGLSPYRLADRPVPAPDTATFVRLAPDSIREEQMLRLFTGRSEKFSQMVRFYVFMPVLPQSFGTSDVAGPPRVLARFNDADASPAVVRRPYGRGTVIMWTTGVDTKWTNWPKDLSFLPVMNDMAWELARVDDNEFTDIVGRAITYDIPPHLSEATSILLKTPAYPNEELRALHVHHDGPRKLVSYADARDAGVYELAFILADRSRHTVAFSRRVDPGECDLRKATQAQIDAAVNRPYRYFPDLATTGTTEEDTTPRRAFWWILLGILLGVLALESVLAQRFGHYQPRMKSALDPAS